MLDTPPERRLDGRVCLLTGATAGIGREAALALARAGAELVIVGRSASRVRRVEREVQSTMPGTRVLGLVADLSSQADVRQLAAHVLERVPRLHVLINNAAVVTTTREESVDGIEMQLAVNHLAPFLLTSLLLRRLAENAPARVVSVASQVEREGRIAFEDLNGTRSYNAARAYSQSKLANILFVRELARRTRGMGITAVSLHPGVYPTRLLDTLMGWSPLVTRVRGRNLPGPERGAQVIVHAAAAPELASDSAIHLHEHTLAVPSELARDEDAARRLWDESARLTGVST
jgi:retinol dehydrogenase-12